MAVPNMAQSNDALLIQVDLGMTPMCTSVPRQLTRDQMTSFFLESWITNYETLHQAIRPIQSNNPFFIRKDNGEVKTRFLVTPPKKKDITVFPTQIAMLQQVSYVGEDGLKINAFREDGKPCYEANHPLTTYGGIFVIVLTVKKKKVLKNIIQEEGRKNPPNRSSKKDMKQAIQKLISLENYLENLIIMFFILEPENKKSLLLHVRKIMIKTLNPY